jgi:hypothetical protein
MPENGNAKRMGWRAVLQVSLVNISVGQVPTLLNSTLNLVMIHEFWIAATLVAVLRFHVLFRRCRNASTGSGAICSPVLWHDAS